MKFKILSTLAVATMLLTGAAASVAADNASDAMTSLKVQLALLDKLGTDGLHVDVHSNGSTVQLSGAVYKRATAELAEAVAASVPGVKTVDNDIEVKGDTAGPVGSAVTEGENEVRDAVLKSKVRLALIDKLGADGFKISTDIASGVVTLGFPADMPAGRRSEAKATAQAVGGAKEVITVEKH
jgi:osmotically-inducible protein OsmY